MADGIRALRFLCEAFGFEERLRMPRPDGTLMHAEAGLGDSVVMLGTPVDDAGKPSVGPVAVRHGSVMCYVDDVDAHHARARDAGATIVTAPYDRPDGLRMFTATDPEGHEWHFAASPPDGGGS